MYLLPRIINLVADPRFIQRVYQWARRKKHDVMEAVVDACRDEHPVIYFNWNLPPRRWDDMTKLHWCATRFIWQRRKLYAVLSACIWPAKAVVLALRMTRQHGAQVRRKAGVSLSRQFFEQLYLAVRYFIAPRAYYFYRLYEEENRKWTPLYVQDHEIVPLLKLVSRGIDYEVFNDKRRFFAECRRRGLPAIPIIAEFEAGALKQWGDGFGGRLPLTDLFAKPALAKGGEGATAYTFQEPGLYRCVDGTLKTEEQLLVSLAEASRKHPYILQERFASHPEISMLAPGALCTSRVVTCRLPDESCEEIMAIFKMPAGACCTDNFSSGGFAIAVDKESGQLGSGIGKNLDADRADVHPVTGERIAGFRIPHWQQAIQLCLRAHAAFPAYAYIGWDVAVTESGPVLVEGNLRWGVESMQRGQGRPLGETRFAESMILHLRHRGCSLLRPDLPSSKNNI